MAAQNFIVFISLGFLGLDSNTHSAYIVSATVRDQDVIKVSKADRTIVFVDLSPLSIFISMFTGVFIYKFNFVLLIVCLNSYFISIFQFLCVRSIDFFHDTLLFLYFLHVNLFTVQLEAN